MQLRKSLIALALTSALAACGSDSKNTELSDPPDSAPTPTQTVVEGKAIKGILTNAVVTVYKFIDGSPVVLTTEELNQADISTDDKGVYSFTILDYEGPIKVQLSPSTDPANPTTMSCDAPAGCGAIKFGQPIDLTAIDPNFKLEAISIVDSSSNGEVKLNVSALTHLAAALIEADTDGINAESVTKNSAKIASTFGIKGDITLLEPTVTDKASAVAAEDNEAELRYGLINAGIMSALFSGESDGTGILSTKLAQVATDLVTNDGAFLVSQDEDDGFELALTEVLAGASEVAKLTATTIAADDSLTSLSNLTQFETQLVNEQAYQEANVGDDGFANIVIDVPTKGNAVTKAKAMVNDVRLFTHLFDDVTDEGKGIKAEGDKYVTLLDNAGIMIKTEAENFKLLAQISNALADLTLQYNAKTLTPEATALGVSIADYLTTVGAVGTITFEENTATDGILFKINATAGAEKVALNASAEFSADKKSITLTIDGLLESKGAKFTLNEGSFAKINMDTAGSRDALANDTYQGKVNSGELELTLSLAQKATDLVPNPVTFEGMVKTKLLPVAERVLNERWDWNSQTEQEGVYYGRPELETLALPEILNLSGTFSSLENDSIKATLTVNINNLEDYEAPEFKYIGKEVADVVNITFSTDLNTVVITETGKVSDEQQTTETRIFTPSSETGEWSATSSVISANPEEHYWGTGIERKIITKRFNSDLDEKGVIYTRAYISGEEESNFSIKSVRITPVDSDNNATTDSYFFEAISSAWDDKEYDGTSFATLMDTNGNILTSDGNPHNWDSAWSIGYFPSIDAFIKAESSQLIANPLTVSNGAELLAQTITNWWGNERTLTIDELGRATFFFNEEELADIAAGEFTELNPTAYLTQPLIKDAFSIMVSADSNTVIAQAGDDKRVYTVDYTSPGNFTFNRETFDSNGYNHSDSRNYTTNNNAGLDIKGVTIVRVNGSNSDKYYSLTRIIPVDNNEDGIADYLNKSTTWGDNITAENILTDENGNTIVENPADYYADSYVDQTLDWNVLFNPFTVTNALDAYKGWLTNARGSLLSSWVEGIGLLENNLSSEEIASLLANKTTLFDGINTAAWSRDSLEDENTFLNVNAALTLEAILGDYQVKLQLSGQRTELEEGAFDLDMSYRLPGADTQRSFTAQYNTEVAGRLTANNADGVVLVLNEPDEDATGTQVLGQILVGPTAIVAATIEDRDGLIVIVYSDETTESL